MIGRRCKARERLSRAPLIGRALRDTQSVPSAPDRSQASPSSSAVRPPGRPCASPSRRSPRRNAPRGPAATAAGAHPDPYRTRKLSRPAPMVLQGRPCGRLGRRRPPGRVARARGGEAQKRHLGEGTREGPLFRLRCWRFPRLCEEERPPAPSGPGGLSRSGPPGSHPPCRLAMRAMSPAAFCMSPTRVACFWRVGVLKGVSGSTPLAFDVLARHLAQPLPLPCFGGQTSERGL